MHDSGIKKVIVTHEGEVKVVLEEWRVIPAIRQNRISEVQLSPVATTNSGTDIEEIRNQLRDCPAVVVLKPSDKSIIGVATAMDLLKVQRPWSQTRETALF